MLHFTHGIVTKRFRTVQPLVQPSLTKHWKIVTLNHPRDTDSFMEFIVQRCGSKPNLVNSVEILAGQHFKQGIETERFRAVQPLVQPLHM